jgi:hypothetical protein
MLDVLYVAVETDSANVNLLRPRLDKTPSRIDVIVGELLLDLADVQSISH